MQINTSSSCSESPTFSIVVQGPIVNQDPRQPKAEQGRPRRTKTGLGWGGILCTGPLNGSFAAWRCRRQSCGCRQLVVVVVVASLLRVTPRQRRVKHVDNDNNCEQQQQQQTKHLSNNKPLRQQSVAPLQLFPSRTVLLSNYSPLPPPVPPSTRPFNHPSARRPRQRLNFKWPNS